MANTYTWTVTSLSTLPSPPAPINEYVVTAYYTVTGTDGVNTATLQSNATFSIDTTGATIPYNDLTEEQVLGWIQAQPNVVVNTQANIDGQLASIVTPPITPQNTPLPW
jgi:hypothetical protein